MQGQKFLKNILKVITVSFLIITGCSSTNDSFSSLKNQGVLPISSDNPYLGSNLFLSNEFSKSNNLYNFFKGRGGPNAIEVKESQFGSGTEMKLYYPAEKEYFIASLYSTEDSYQWITRGPYRIERHIYRDIAGLFEQGVSEPQFAYDGKPFKFKYTQAEILAANPTPVPTIKPMPRVIHKPKIKDSSVKSKLAQDNQNTVAATPTPFKPLTYDQQALAMSQGFAERASNGDLVHTVKVNTETAEQIAQWYTGNASNAAEILKSNGIASGTALNVGTRIQIPLSLVKQFKRM
jgi:hypothetical protein